MANFVAVWSGLLGLFMKFHFCGREYPSGNWRSESGSITGMIIGVTMGGGVSFSDIRSDSLGGFAPSEGTK